MIINYLKIASRNMLRNKTQSFVGIFGLAFALACLVPAVYWMRYETTFDNFYPESKQIHRVYTFDNETGQTNDLVSGILQRKLQEHSPAMQMSTVFYSEKNDCQSERLAHIQLQMIFADSSFLTVFPQTIISGQTHNPLQITNDIIISETCAKRLFGTIENSIGKQIKSTLFGWHPPYTVTAVVKDPPQNTNVSFDAILCSDDLLNQKSFIETSVSQIWTDRKSVV